MTINLSLKSVSCKISKIYHDQTYIYPQLHLATTSRKRTVVCIGGEVVEWRVYDAICVRDSARFIVDGGHHACYPSIDSRRDGCTRRERERGTVLSIFQARVAVIRVNRLVVCSQPHALYWVPVDGHVNVNDSVCVLRFFTYLSCLWQGEVDVRRILWRWAIKWMKNEWVWMIWVGRLLANQNCTEVWTIFIRKWTRRINA